MASTKKKDTKEDSQLVKLLKNILLQYESKCTEYDVSPCSTVLKTIKNAIDEEILIIRFTVHPQDRNCVEYWDDRHLVRFIDASEAERSAVRQKSQNKNIRKSMKPLVRVLPLLEVIQNNRYVPIKELIVWNVLMEHSDMLAMSSLLGSGAYQFIMIELINCFLDAKALQPVMPKINFTKTLTKLVLDHNEFGDEGCEVICGGLNGCKWLTSLSMCYCDLQKQSGFYIGPLIVQTSIRELYLTGNNIGVDGTVAMLYELADRIGGLLIAKMRAQEDAAETAAAEKLKGRINFTDAQTNISNLVDLHGDEEPSNQSCHSDVDFRREKPASSMSTIDEEDESAEGSKKAPKPPPCGPDIEVLHLAANSINSVTRGGAFAVVRCMQLFKKIISHCKALREIDLVGNEIGDVGARTLVEGVVARLDGRLPRIGLYISHVSIQQDTFDTIKRLAPGPKAKKPKKNAKTKNKR